MVAFLGTSPSKKPDSLDMTGGLPSRCWQLQSALCKFLCCPTRLSFPLSGLLLAVCYFWLSNGPQQDWIALIPGCGWASGHEWGCT